MKFITKKTLAVVLFGGSVLFLWWCKNTQVYENQQATNSEYVVDQSDILDPSIVSNIVTSWGLSDQEKSGLIQMREEEKLARDVYTTLWAKWGNKIFTNIAQSEQTHTQAVKNLLDAYALPDPVTDDTVWVFVSPTMQKLYTDLVSQGNISLLDALIVWATIEDLDIKDLNVFVQETSNPAIISVYDNLNRGSRNHLRAYIKNINNNNGTYIPQYISQWEYTDIVSSQQERGSAWMRNGAVR
jgi:hypothetical protein